MSTMSNRHDCAWTRREFMGLLAGGAAGTALAPHAALSDGPVTPPNFVVIFVDDLGYDDLGCYWTPNGAPGYEQILTPNLDQMAADGIRFTDFYANAAVCTPARASMMTGCYSYRVGLNWHVLTPAATIGLNPNEQTIAKLLKARGYATGCFGKWHLGHHAPFYPTNHGFDRWLGLLLGNRDGTSEQLVRQTELVADTGAFPHEVQTQILLEEALDFITANQANPFYLYLPLTMPHTPLRASNKFAGSSARGPYGDVVAEVDWSVGRVLARLQELGLDDNTLVLFTSDNGPWLCKGDDGGKAYPLNWGKSTIFEGGYRVPCIARWPGKIPAGQVSSEPVGIIDLCPTLAALAGAQVPRDRVIDGRSIWPILNGTPGATSPHEALFYVDNNYVAAVRKGPWKFRREWLLEYGDVLTPAEMTAHLAGGGQHKETLPEALYNLDDDIGETSNVLAQNPGVVNELRGILLDFEAEIEANKRPVGSVAG